MQLKDYQQGALRVFDDYLGLLRAEFEKSAAAEAALRAAKIDLLGEVLDFPNRAWEAGAAAGVVTSEQPYSRREDGIGRAVPSVCFKVPTGGGKTLLGAWGAGAVLQRYLQTNRGFILWIVPNEAIYTQTKKQLTNRDHPYRQTLARAAAGDDRLVVLEKDDPLAAADVRGHLCVMLLMLQSANRITKEQLRLFRDRGNVLGFFPPESDAPAHEALLRQTTNLDHYGDENAPARLVKDSFGNVLRVLRPIIVLDEGHKAYSQLALTTLYGFNPSFVLELSATPPIGANRLVDVKGADLDREEMIKLPINLDIKSGNDWKACLRAAFGRLQSLDAEAKTLLAETGRYIRPILLIQVERTGREQRDPRYVHARDVVDYLERLGLHADEIAQKTAQINELKDPARENLLAPTNRIRAIVTKRALQEGWDCPFAYVLCSLSASADLTGMTQIVGRVLRQPDARRTGRAALDECYVYCHHVDTASAVTAIKASLEADGLGDLTGKVVQGGDAQRAAPRVVKRRDRFETTSIYLPRVLWVAERETRDLEYERDILSNIDWARADMTTLADGLALGVSDADSVTLRAGLELLDDVDRDEIAPQLYRERGCFDYAYATRVLVDIVGNAWLTRTLVGRVLARLAQRGADAEEIGGASGYLLDGMWKGLSAERDRLAEDFFRASVRDGRIQFRLRTDLLNWEVPFDLPTTQIGAAALLYRSTDAKPVQKSLFAPMYAKDFNSLEAEFACYLDEESTLTWWFRNVAKRAYAIQGWQAHRIYPDFILALDRGSGTNKFVVLETKGDQLGGPDTRYKQALLGVVSGAFQIEHVKAGELELLLSNDTVVVCDLVFGSTWKSDLHNRHLS